MRSSKPVFYNINKIKGFGLFHYTYSIQNIITQKRYIGVRTSLIEPYEDLGYKYFSSSTDVEFVNEQKINPINFIYDVIGIFNSRKEAVTHEIELHNFYDVAKNKNFYNKVKQTTTGFDTTGCISWNKGVSPNPNSIKKMVHTRNLDNSYITGGAKTSKTVTNILPNGTTIAKERSKKSAKVMKIKQKDGKTIREKAEEKRTKTLKEIVIYEDVKMTKLKRLGKKVSKGLKEIIIFEGVEMTKLEKRTLLWKRSYYNKREK